MMSWEIYTLFGITQDVVVENIFSDKKNYVLIFFIFPQVGLDPGIDHLLALECFDEVHTGGGKVESFVSFCGGNFFKKKNLKSKLFTKIY